MAKINIKFNGENYHIDPSILTDAAAAFHLYLKKIEDASAGSDTYTPGLYQAGAIALYEEQGPEAIEGMLITSWEDLLSNDVLKISNTVVGTNFTFNAETEEIEYLSSPYLTGDLFLPNDGSVSTIGELTDNPETSMFPFSGCTELTGIYIPEAVTSMCSSTFTGCVSLSKIVLPKTITRIPEYCLHGCSSLEAFELTENITSIGTYAFMESGITYLEIPDSAEYVYGTFVGMANLVEVKLPSNITHIQTEMFSGCSSLERIDLPRSVNSIDWYAFASCSSLSEITYDGTVAEWMAIEKAPNWISEAPATGVQCSDGFAAFAK